MDGKNWWAYYLMVIKSQDFLSPGKLNFNVKITHVKLEIFKIFHFFLNYGYLYMSSYFLFNGVEHKPYYFKTCKVQKHTARNSSIFSQYMSKSTQG